MSGLESMSVARPLEVMTVPAARPLLDTISALARVVLAADHYQRTGTLPTWATGTERR